MKEWHHIDLHMHTVKGITGDNKKDEIKNFTYENFINSLHNANVELAAITNHNLIDVKNYCLCKYLGRKRGINILCGVELDIGETANEDFHYILIINEDLVKTIKFSENINNNVNECKQKNHKIRFKIDDVFKIVKNYNALFIPHGTKSKGVLNDLNSEEKVKELFANIKEGFFKVFDNSSDFFMKKLKSRMNEIIADTNNEISKISGVIFSDNRNWLSYKNTKFYMNALPTYDGFLLSISNPAERFSFFDYIPQKANYISTIRIHSNNELLDSAEIKLSSGLNCIIGKSGSGKSLLNYLIINALKGNNLQFSVNYSKYTNKISSIELLNENGMKIMPNSINFGQGDPIYNKLLLYTTNDNGDSVYEIIKKLNPDFPLKKKYSEIISNYKTKLYEYLQKSSDIKKQIANLTSDLNQLSQNNILLAKLKNVTHFSLKQKQQNDLSFDEPEISQLKSIYKDIENIKEKVLLFDKKDQDELLTSLHSFKEMYLIKITYIVNSYAKEKIANHKIDLINECIKKVNKNISDNAELKSNLSFSISNISKKIISEIISLYKNKEILKRMDFSLKSADFYTKEELVPGSNFFVEEFIDEDLLKKFDIKNNSVFHMHGSKSKLESNFFNLENKKEALEVLDKYFKEDILSEKFISESFVNSFYKVNLFINDDNVLKLNPGTISKEFLNFYFKYNLCKDKNSIILYDQIENDVDKHFISSELLGMISELKNKVQVILITHEPIIAVNGDPTRYILSEKNSFGQISYRSFSLEDNLVENLNLLANTVDGSIDVIKDRYFKYKGGKI